MAELQIKVAQAVHVLNHDTQSCNRVAANQWLVQFQQTEAAWEISTSILTSDHHHHRLVSADYEVEFFAAQILKRKIQNEGYNLHSGAKDALLHALLLAAQRFSSGPPQLLTQICLSLSTLLLQAVEHEKPIEKLFYNLQKLQRQDNGNNAVLELLTVLPEIVEDHNSECHVTSARRYEYGQELLARTPMILEFLTQQLTDGCEQALSRNKILRCLLSWVRAGCFSEIPPSSLSVHPLFNFVFSSLQVASSFDMAVEVLIELVSRHLGIPQVLLCRIGFLRDALLLPALKSGDEKVIGRLACLMSEIGQAVPFLIEEASSEALALTNSILSCVAFPSKEWEIADSTLPFWSSLVGYILGLEEGNAVNRKSLKEHLFPVFSELFDAILLRAQIDDSSCNDNGRYLGLPNAFEQFRMNLVELLVDICRLLGSSFFIQKVFLGGWIPTGPHISWKEVEAKLFILNTVAEVLLEEGQHFDISSVVNLIIILSREASTELSRFMCLVYRSLANVIGSYAKRMSASPTNITHLILFLATGISQPFCSNACASALHKLCEEAVAVMVEPSNLEILIWIGEGLETRQLPLEDEDEVICAIAFIFCSVTDKKLMKILFARLLSPSYEKIRKLHSKALSSILKPKKLLPVLKVAVTLITYAATLMQIDESHGHSLSQDPSIRSESINSAGRGLHRIGTLFNYLAAHLSSDVEPDESISAVFEVFWPLLEKLLFSRHIENASLSTAACRALSLAIKAAGQKFGVMLPNILDAISTNFLSLPNHECYIRTASVIIEEFGSKEEFGALFINTFERFSCSTSVTALSSSYICDQEPDLAEAYMNFASSYMRSCSKEVLAASGSLLEVSMQKAGICCTALHRGAALSAMSYMTCVLEVGLATLRETATSTSGRSIQDTMMKVISLCGEGLISNLVYALLGVTAVSRVHKSSTVLQQVAALCSLSERSQWRDILCWNTLNTWLYTATLPAEYLKKGEVELLVSTWMKALVDAASDYPEREEMNNQGHRMQGKSGKFLKRLLREFADNHRSVPSYT